MVYGVFPQHAFCVTNYPGGQSVWGKPFKDEFRPNLSHSGMCAPVSIQFIAAISAFMCVCVRAGRGILSMANSGKNTNKSQL